MPHDPSFMEKGTPLNSWEAAGWDYWSPWRRVPPSPQAQAQSSPAAQGEWEGQNPFIKHRELTV